MPPPSPGRQVVAVAMSGGVDSSVAAGLCVAAGYDVVGIMLRLWTEPGAEGTNRCCTPDAVDDARAVADRLEIPFHLLDITDEFKSAVVDDFLASAAAGDTPNPCFTCNRKVRFGLLLSRALAVGADLLATGHYARVEHVDDRWRLLRGVDPGKDQSYVLHRLDQDRLSRAMFPLGPLLKPDVRRLAEAMELPVAQRADSVDLCWVGDKGLPGFLARHMSQDALAPGPILGPDGNEVGRHEGLPRYTLGQRRGLGVALGAPAYVVGRDVARNALIVGPDEMLWTRELRVRTMHWIAGEPPADALAGDGAPFDDAFRPVEGDEGVHSRASSPGMRVTAQIRYRAAAAPARLRATADGGAWLRFDEPVRAPTRGQGLVAWRGDEVVGGGPIATDAAAA